MKTIILGHEGPDVDSIVSGYLLEKILHKNNIDAEFIIPDKNITDENINICSKYGLDPRRFQKELPDYECNYILVDHNNRSVRGNVIEIIDHHPNIKGMNALVNINLFKSSTSCIIAQKYYDLLSVEDLKLAIVAAMCDTASFNSTKSNLEDLEWIRKVCKDKNLDYEELYNTGLCLTEINSVEEASFNGFKKYNIDNVQIYSSYIQVRDIKSKQSFIDEVIDYLRNYIYESNIDYFVFIVHDMSVFKTTVYQISKDEVKVINYDKYTSRGNNIIPDVIKSINAVDKR